jgi:chromosome partitioning protein
LWLLNPIQPPTGYPDRIASSIPVLAIANLKGGVGKTTLAANLAAYFADSDRESPERVLLIDLDYQGSLSLMCAGGEPPVPEPGLHSLATQAIAGTNDAPTIVLSAREVPGCDLVNIIQSFFDLAKEENRLMVHWLIREEQNDIRYNLANLILNELVQRRFNRVIIDCPPRLSTSCVQALCATTHVLIPTVLHPTSTSAVRTFLDQLRSHKDIWPELKRISVVGTMTAGNLGEGGALQNVEHAALESLRRDLHAFGRSGGLHPALLEEATFIQRRTAIADATGTGIAYIRDIGNLDAQLREMFARLGRKIIEREAE